MRPHTEIAEPVADQRAALEADGPDVVQRDRERTVRADRRDHRAVETR